MKRAIVLLFALALTGCMVGPNYKRPTLDVPPTWRFEEKEAKEVANTAWWEQFDDPVLNDLIEAAVRENKDLKIATARIEQFAGQLQTTRAALFPQVGAAGTAGRQRTSEHTGPSPLDQVRTANPTFNDYQVFINASWEIDVWGKLRRATEAARANLLSTEEGRRSVLLTLVAAVANSYVNLLNLDKQLEVTRSTTKSYKEAWDLFKLRYQHGIVSEMEVAQTRAQYEQAQANIPFFEKAIAQQENALCVLLGRNPGPIPRGKTIDQLNLPAVPAGLPSGLLTSRPDVRQAEQDLVAANANIGVAKAQYFPSISLTGLFGFASADLSTLFKGPSKMWSFAAPMTAPIFTGGAIAGQVKSAEAIQRETLVRYQQVIQAAFLDVDNALIDQKRTREQLESLNQQVEALRDYVRFGWLRYDNGYVSYLEVLYAETLLYNAELTITGAQAGLFQALVNCYKAMGGGWVMEADKVTGLRAKE